jgi:nicotinamidase-related amidase
MADPSPMPYQNRLHPIRKPPPILADYPQFVEPLQADRRFLAPPVVCEPDADLTVRSWRFWYNARGIVEMENRLQAAATAIIVVHPWGVDDGHGLKTPEPAGVAFFCTREKNLIGLEHMKQVISPFLRRLRSRVALVGYSMPGVEDDIRGSMYPSISDPAERLNVAEGERRLAEALAAHQSETHPLVEELSMDSRCPVRSYFDQTPSTDARENYNAPGFWQQPMPVATAIQRGPRDLVFYDGEGYPKVRGYLQSRGVRHVLLCGYATDMCLIKTTCGYENLCQDFNVFVVGDATLACFPASTTPRFATQVALTNAALTQMITQVSWVKLAKRTVR